MSDSVTRPSEAMVKAMSAHARVVVHSMRDEDPAVRELERRAAALLGKEAALLLPTGTMANQVAVRSWCLGVPAPVVVADDRAHVVRHEGGGASLHAGAEIRAVPGEGGAVPAAALRDALAPPPKATALLHPVPALVVVENSHNLEGGVAVPLARMREIHEIARAAGVPVHLDGARLLNAALALGTTAEDLAGEAESVMISLTKGLGAPYGSLLAGPATFVENARRFRQVMGGAVYKAGIFAAAGIVALEEGPRRLAEDHAHARILADALARGGAVPRKPDTNIVVFDVAPLGTSAEEFAGAAAARGVRVAAIGRTIVRAVLHGDVSRGDAERAAGILRSVAEDLPARRP